MKRRVALLFAVISCLVGCGRGSPQEPRIDSHLQVYVHWEEMGLAEKRIQIPELGFEKLSDAKGLAVFDMPAGQYTVRAYGINDAGPPPLYVERSVTTTRGDTTTVDIVDCLPCVAARQGS